MPTKAHGQLGAYFRIVGVEGNAPVHLTVLQADPTLVANGDAVDLSPQLTPTGCIPGSVPVIGASEAHPRETKSMVCRQSQQLFHAFGATGMETKLTS